MDGTQEVPPNGSPATGIAHTVIDLSTNTLFYHISYSGLTGTEFAAHIHGFAPPGQNAGVLHGLPPSNPKVGAWTYADAQEDDIRKGLTYVNIHTNPSFSGGEIRGQLVVMQTTDIVALCNGAQEVPPNGSTGLGIGAFDIDTAANTLAFDIRTGLLTGTEFAAHIHRGAIGENGGVIFGLPGGSIKTGTWNYPEVEEINLTTGNAYVNIHTNPNFGGGEIRGQFESQSPAVGVNVTFPATGDLSLFAAPNPLPHDDLALFYRAPQGEAIEVDIVDVNGRVVRTLPRVASTRTGIFAWDTRDDAGARVAGGVYFARIRAGAAEASTRFVVLR
jgi:hypothetical protein